MSTKSPASPSEVELVAPREVVGKPGRVVSSRLPRIKEDLRKIDVSKLQKGAVGKYKLYVEQLANAELPGDVVQDISTLGDLEVLYRRRVMVEDLCALMAIGGMILMIIVNEVMADEAEARERDADGRLQYKDSGITWTMKLAVSVSTAFVIALLIARAKINTRVRRLRNLLPPHASILNWDILWPLLLEVFICLLHIPPGWDEEVNITWASSRFHINEMGCIMLLRVYMIARVIRNHSGYYSRMNAFIGSLHDVESASISFTLKLLFRNRPANLLIPCILCCIFVCTVCLRILERRSDESDIKSYYDAVWVSVVTMSTVGYGDLVPQTLSGRVVVVVFGIVGGALLLTLVTAVFIEFLTLDDAERRVVTSIRRRDWERHLRYWSVTLIANGWRLRKVQLRIRTATSAGRFSEARRLRRAELDASASLFNAMFRFRRLRRSAPPAAVDESEIRFASIDSKLNLILDHLGIEYEPTPLDPHGSGTRLDATGVLMAMGAGSSRRRMGDTHSTGTATSSVDTGSPERTTGHNGHLRDKPVLPKMGGVFVSATTAVDPRRSGPRLRPATDGKHREDSSSDEDNGQKGHRRTHSAEPSPRAGRERKRGSRTGQRRAHGDSKHGTGTRQRRRDRSSRTGNGVALGVDRRTGTVADLL